MRGQRVPPEVPRGYVAARFRTIKTRRRGVYLHMDDVRALVRLLDDGESRRRDVLAALDQAERES